MSGGKCGVPVGSTMAKTWLVRRRLLSRRPDGLKRGGECKNGPAPKRQKYTCSNICVGCSFNKNAYILTQRALSSSLSKYGAPPQVIATQPTTNPLKPLCEFMSAWEVIPGISRWLLGVIERGFTLQFRRRPPRFNGVVQCLTLPWNAQVLRREVCCVLEKRAVEQVPPSELESGFYSRYFVVPKRDGDSARF